MKTGFKDQQAQWRTRWSADMSVPANRRAAHFDMMMFDHGLLRILWRNCEQIAPDVWRSNQPSPVQIRRLARNGIRTVINLRGPSTWGSYVLEEETCQQAGLNLINARLYSRNLPTAEEIEALFAIFERAERPLVMHCKSGADRAGLGAALYLLWAGQPPRQAARQLSWRYLHFKTARTGILDALVAAYIEAHDKTGIAFDDWLRTDYDRAALMDNARPARLADWLVDRLLRRE